MLNIRNLCRQYLDFRFAPSRHLQVRIVERPGLWMPAPEAAQMVEDIRALAKKAVVGGDLNYGIFTGQPAVLASCLVCLVTDKASGKLIAFNAMRFLPVDLGTQRPVDIVHLGLVVIDPEARGNGISWLLYGLPCNLLLVRNVLRPIWFSNVTQVPAIVGQVSESFRQVYPSPLPDSRRSFPQLLIAREMMQHHRAAFGVGAEATFDEQRFVIGNSYTGGSDNLKKTFASAPKHRRAVFNDFCAQELDYARGDDVLQLGIFDLQAMKDYLLKKVPRRSLLGLSYKLLFLLVASVLVPMVQWFCVRAEYGDIRANNKLT